MVIAIEPMVNVGSHDVKEMSDGWTVKTADGTLSAHYENTVAITSEGVIVLTEV
jgi:methionyl aminopeptidase